MLVLSLVGFVFEVVVSDVSIPWPRGAGQEQAVCQEARSAGWGHGAGY